MSYQVSWFQEPRILYVRYYGKLTAEDIHEANSQALIHLDAATTPPVHTLVNVIDMTELGFVFKDVLKDEAVINVSSHKKLGWVVYFNKQNPIYTFMANVVGQSYEEKVKFLDTEAEAVSFLQRIDPTLNPA